MRLKDRPVWRDIESIMIVDDEPRSVSTVVDHLKREGFRVAIVTDSESALQIVATSPVDLAVVDMVLGNGNRDCGFYVTQEIKKKRPQTRVLILSGACFDGEAPTTALRLGADNYLQKTGFPNVLDVAFDPPSTDLPPIRADRRRRTLDEIKKDALDEALRECGNNRTAAAIRLGIARTTVQDMLKK